jgi:SHS2 domain-containing protein
MTASSHEFAEHTSELRLRLRAGAPGELYAEAARALGGLLLRDAGGAGPEVTRELTVEGADPEALLVDWLNELLWQAEAERWVPRAVTVLEVTPTRLRARVTGPRVREPPVLVKAATHHGVRVTEGPTGWEAEVVLDI